MWITGYTSSRLNEVKTLDPNNPYKVGVKGVYNVQPDFIEYYLDGILYKTYIQNIPTFFQRGKNSDFNRVSNLKTYNTPLKFLDPYKQNTIFKYQPSRDNFEYKPLIKEENKLEQVFLPEIEDEIFIERTFTNVYERHMRLMDINNIGQLEIYKNGFFNVKRI
jgi:hypothetical protein